MQTKFLLGIGTNPVEVPPDGVERAVARLRTDFKFVGDTDDYELSATLRGIDQRAGRSRRRDVGASPPR